MDLSALMVVGGIVANGFVTWGVVKTQLRYLHEGVHEAKASAIDAHKRIDNVLLMERG